MRTLAMWKRLRIRERCWPRTSRTFGQPSMGWKQKAAGIAANPTAVRPVRVVRHRAVSQVPVRVARAVKRAKGASDVRVIASVQIRIVVSAQSISVLGGTATALMGAATMEDHKEVKS